MVCINNNLTVYQKSDTQNEQSFSFIFFDIKYD